MDNMKLDDFIEQSIAAIKNGVHGSSDPPSVIEVEFDLCISCLDSNVHVVPTFSGENPNASKIKFKIEVEANKGNT